tara:strand:- start:41 stop:958 length:918 start_codon:yes stop_codon:yes gene_type:complete
MNIYLNNPKESWVVDRFVKEWNTYNLKQDKTYFYGTKTIWIIAPWMWKKIPIKYLKKNKVLCTIHHIDEDKFDNDQKNDFLERDKYVDVYHVISKKTYDQVTKLTNKPIKTIPFWVNQNIWYEIEKKDNLRKKYNISKNAFVLGSFQRDTEGSDLISPKLSKGPDQFLEIVSYFNTKHDDLIVILTGKRRNYLINEFNKNKIQYKYIEMANFEKINDLYNILDLYIVSSRYEGGPQSILECAASKTPIISTDVGIAREILNEKSIFDMNNFKFAKPDIEYAHKRVKNLFIPSGFKAYNEILGEMN